MRHTPQRYRVLRLALGTPDFTRRDAAYHVGCFELASRIGELEAEGARFARDRRVIPDRYGRPSRVTAYRLTHCPPALGARAGWVT